MARILVIDDEEMVRETIKGILQKEGYVVEMARDGLDGMAMLEAGPADLVITDILMPKKDGIEVTIELRRKYPSIKILAVSGGDRLNQNTYLDNAKKLGADAILPKPFRGDELLAAVKGVLEM